jgi:taurine dioxygenase
MSKRILVVEDQPDNRQIIRDMLAPIDYEITEADHGRLYCHAQNQGRSLLCNPLARGARPANRGDQTPTKGEPPMNHPFAFNMGEPLVTVDAGITVHKVGVHLGAEISGVDLRKPLSEAQFKAIEAALVEHELIIFRDQDITSGQLMQFGRRFGPLTVHPFAPNEGRDAPELIKFRNDEKTPPYGTDVWHSDETFRAEPPMATILIAKEVPAVGGDTMFVSMTAAYEGLSDRMQQFVSGLEGIHDMKPFRPLFGKSEDERKKLQQFELLYPPVLHPVVRVHPVSGKKALFVNPQFTVGINGMEEHESRALLDLLFRQALVPEYQFRHRWAPHTIAMWDNRSTQHYAVHDYYPQRRYMERVTIKGGPVTGMTKADPASIRRLKYVAPPGVDVHGGHKPH